MENIEQMRQRHKKEIDDLQISCSHQDISDWLPFMWVPGHFSNDVKVCNACGKIMEQRPIEAITLYNDDFWEKLQRSQNSKNTINKEGVKKRKMNRVREFRQKAGLSQAELARRTHVASPNLSAVENDQRIAWPKLRRRLARSLKTTEAELFPPKG